jgi:hypothetical protein
MIILVLLKNIQENLKNNIILTLFLIEPEGYVVWNFVVSVVILKSL